MEFPINLGQFEVICKSLVQMNTKLKCMRVGDSVHLKLEKLKQDQQHAQRGRKKKVSSEQNPNIVRLVWNEQEIARVDNLQASVLFPLIDNFYISVEG